LGAASLIKGCKFYYDKERRAAGGDFTFMVEIVVLGSNLLFWQNGIFLAQICCLLNIFSGLWWYILSC